MFITVVALIVKIKDDLVTLVKKLETCQKKIAEKLNVEKTHFASSMCQNITVCKWWTLSWAVYYTVSSTLWSEIVHLRNAYVPFWELGQDT